MITNRPLIQEMFKEGLRAEGNRYQRETHIYKKEIKSTGNSNYIWQIYTIVFLLFKYF